MSCLAAHDHPLFAAIFLFAGDKKNSPFITGWVCNTLTGLT
jgi:hypothetical protein